VHGTLAHESGQLGWEIVGSHAAQALELSIRGQRAGEVAGLAQDPTESEQGSRSHLSVGTAGKRAVAIGDAGRRAAGELGSLDCGERPGRLRRDAEGGHEGKAAHWRQADAAGAHGHRNPWGHVPPSGLETSRDRPDSRGEIVAKSRRDRYSKRMTDAVSIGGLVETVTISPKFQVVIPKAIRTRLGLRAGQKVQAIVYQNRIELVPVRPVRQLKGFLRGIDTTVPRERDRA